MSLPRLFLPPGTALPPAGQEVGLPEEADHYLRRVLRLQAGDRVLLLDGRQRAEAVLLGAGRLRVEHAEAAGPAAARQLTLLLGLLKGEKMDWVVQKATELGVSRIVPVACARSVRRLEAARAAQLRERWRRIATAAAQQSRRDDVPEVAGVVELAEALQAPLGALRLVLWEEARAHLHSTLPAAPPPAVALLIGPEGGLEAAEVRAAEEAGFSVCSLGPRILRAETAALAALAILDHWAPWVDAP